MPTSARFAMPVAQWMAANGGTLQGGKLYFYESGTSTPLDVYQDAALTTAFVQPVTAGADGVWPEIWLAGGSYKVVLQDASSSVIWTADPMEDVAAQIYASTAAVAAARIAPDTAVVRLNGWLSAGDGGEVSLRKVPSEPTHSLKVQSLDGAWWEVFGPSIPIVCGGATPSYSGEVAGCSFASSSSGLTLGAPLGYDVVGWTVAIRRGTSGTAGSSTVAPFQSEKFTVVAQSGTSITLSGNATITMSGDGVALFYRDNAAAIQAVVDHAAALGAEVYVPAGNWATGPVYLPDGLYFRGAGQENAFLFFTQGNGFSPFRHCVLQPDNINTSTGRHKPDALSTDVRITDLTIDGNALWQNPLGTSYTNGSFALHCINLVYTSGWIVERVTARNAQGDGVYFGSFQAPDGTFEEVYTRAATFRDSLVTGNWRNGSQIGNARDCLIENIRYVDNSVGYKETIDRSIYKGTYSFEEIDFEANSGGIAGRNTIFACYFTSSNGRAIDISFDQVDTRILGCTFRRLALGCLTMSRLPDTEGDVLGERTLIEGNVFEGDVDTNGPLLRVTHRGVRVIGNTFKGAVNNTGNGAVIVDRGGFDDGYVVSDILFADNTFQLNGSGTDRAIAVENHPNIRDLCWTESNRIIEGFLRMPGGRTMGERVTLRADGVKAEQSGPCFTTQNSNSFLLRQKGGFGIGDSDFTFIARIAYTEATAPSAPLLGANAATTGEFFVYRQSDGGRSDRFRVDFRQQGGATHTVYVPREALKGVQSVAEYGLRPFDLTIMRDASEDRVQIYFDDILVVEETHEDIGRNFAFGNEFFMLGAGGLATGVIYYQFLAYNRMLTQSELTQARQQGPSLSDRWGSWGGAAGCVNYVKFDPGCGLQFRDQNPVARGDFWGWTEPQFTVRRYAGEVRVPVSASGNTSFGSAPPNYPALPAKAVIRSVEAVTAGTPTIQIGTTSGGSDLVASTALAAGHNQLTLVSGAGYSGAERQVWVNQSAATEVLYNITYEIIE